MEGVSPVFLFFFFPFLFTFFLLASEARAPPPSDNMNQTIWSMYVCMHATSSCLSVGVAVV